jgi:hypothetical protein
LHLLGAEVPESLSKCGVWARARAVPVGAAVLVAKSALGR